MVKKEVREMRTLAADRMSWECQDWENFKDYKRFVFFRDMGPARTIKRFITAYKREDGSAGDARYISAANKWIERCRDWDNYMQVKIDEARIDERQLQERDMVKKHIKNSLVYQQLMTVEMARWLHKAGANTSSPDLTDAPTLSIEEIRKGLNWSMDYERKSMGMPDNTIAVAQQTFEEVSEQFEKKVLSLPKETQVDLANLLAEASTEVVDV